MKRLSILTIAGACAAGLLGGWSASRLNGSLGNAGLHEEVAEQRSAPPRSARARPTASDGPSSSEHFDVIAALLTDATAHSAAYERLALWLLDASAEEIAALWAGVPQPDQTHKEIIDLIFVFWTRLDPEAAIAATAGTSQESFAWWAWACHDPRRALDEAQLRNPKRLYDVGWGIGEFHPRWLRDNQSEIPDGARSSAFSGLWKWMDGLDPIEELRLSRETNSGFSHDLLARYDPEAAWKWVKEQTSPTGPGYLARLANTLEEFHPEMLAKILLEPEAAELRRVVDEERFNRLVAEDVAAARQEAEETGEPRLATSRLTAVGLSLVRENPEEAFRLAQRMLELDPDALFDRALRPGERPEYIGRGQNQEARQLMAALLARDPERVIGMVSANDQTNLAALCETWASLDPVEYAGWVNSGADPSYRNQAAKVLVSNLIQEGDYREAAEWSLSLEKPSAYSFHRLLESWGQKNPFAAEAWLEAADLPDAMKQEIRNPRSEGG